MLASAAVIGAIFLGGVVARVPKARRALAKAAERWHEMHTPGAGRDRVLDPMVLDLVTALRAAGVSHYRFTPGLGEEITLSPFIVEASWPIACSTVDENVVGYVKEFESRPGCAVRAVVGKLALAHCPL
jgi:hypothetical protein